MLEEFRPVKENQDQVFQLECILHGKTFFARVRFRDYIEGFECHYSMFLLSVCNLIFASISRVFLGIGSYIYVVLTKGNV